jgi:hypothetical protein
VEGQASSAAEKGRPAWQGALAGAVAGTAFGLVGFFLLRDAQHPRMGDTLFLLLPVVTGATIAMVTPRVIAGAALLSGTISLVICLLGLIAAKQEGVLCALLAFPLIFGALLIGIGIGLILRALVSNLRRATANFVVLLAAPALLVAGHRLEMKANPQARTENVTTTILLPAGPDKVWVNLQSLDRVAGRKPALMYIGLPIPQRCVLQGTAVGSKRICYFDQGFIEESVLEWDPPRRMRLAIDRTHLPGRHWLEFEGAEYDLKPVANGTELTRITTIRSNLAPAWYWATFEKWGVASEHEYLFSDLVNRFPSQTPR